MSFDIIRYCDTFANYPKTEEGKKITKEEWENAGKSLHYLIQLENDTAFKKFGEICEIWSQEPKKLECYPYGRLISNLWISSLDSGFMEKSIKPFYRKLHSDTFFLSEESKKRMYNNFKTKANGFKESEAIIKLGPLIQKLFIAEIASLRKELHNSITQLKQGDLYAEAAIETLVNKIFYIKINVQEIIEKNKDLELFKCPVVTLPPGFIIEDPIDNYIENDLIKAQKTASKVKNDLKKLLIKLNPYKNNIIAIDKNRNMINEKDIKLLEHSIRKIKEIKEKNRPLENSIIDGYNKYQIIIEKITMESFKKLFKNDYNSYKSNLSHLNLWDNINKLIALGEKLIK